MIGWIWGLFPDWAQWTMIGCAVLFAAGVLWRLKDVIALVKKIAGWPGVAAAIGIIVVIASVIWDWLGGGKPAQPKAGKKSLWPPIGRTAKRTPTPRGKRRYDRDTNEWIDL